MRVDGQPTILSLSKTPRLKMALLVAVGAGGTVVRPALREDAPVRVGLSGVAVADAGLAVGLVPLAGGASHLPGVDRCVPLERVVGMSDADLVEGVNLLTPGRALVLPPALAGDVLTPNVRLQTRLVERVHFIGKMVTVPRDS